MTVDELINRLRSKIVIKNQKALAQMLELKPGAISDAKRRGSVPADWFLTLLRKYGVNPVWLESGQGPVFLGEQTGDLVRVMTADQAAPAPAGRPARDSVRPSADDFILIPVYNVGVGAGPGRVADGEEIIDYLAFKRIWIRKEITGQVDRLFLLYVEGDSMKPTLNAGDIVLVLDVKEESLHDGIYIIRTGEAVQAKRIQRLLDGRIRIISDNKDYAPETVDLDRVQDLAVIGRVVWRAGSI
ncbi:MAG: helix-turn-helix domain-containing protein [Proteobacteria bacterium]|nr:helix-turn-helix domain-containing protein [Pseudomonadota bacterium]